MATPMTRRRLLILSGAGAVLATPTAFATSETEATAKRLDVPLSRAPATAQIGPRMRLHMFQTGWVSVKAEHKSYLGPSGLRFPAIMTSRRWTEWMPITAFAVEHPEGLYVVDTGETARMLQPRYSACDRMTGLFYRRNLRFALAPDDELGPQMLRAGLQPDRVRAVILTHLHSDHMGGMRYFPQAEFLLSQRARRGHTGALMCQIPGDLNLRGISYVEKQSGVFTHSHTVTRDGAITIVPTPGHATGHQSVLIQDAVSSYCVVGDAAFDLNQIINGEMGGIVENVRDTRASATLLKKQFESLGTVMLPTHDPDNASRMVHG